jgi:hypothetical protein
MSEEIFDRFSFFNARHLKREFLAGGIAGSIGIFIGYPFDTVKVNLQAHPTRYASAVDCFKQSIKHEGIGALYRGCLPPILLQGTCLNDS